MYILDTEANKLVEAEIVKGNSKDMPLKKDGWNFNWRTIFKRENTETYILRLKSNPSSVEGVLQLKKFEGLLIMDLVEIAPHNIGRKKKRFDYVAGCLIAFACRESYKLESEYRGFLTFESKTNLIEWYSHHYHAQVALGQKMYIAPKHGEKLIVEYLNRKIANHDKKK